jgi:hypothetical protein
MADQWDSVELARLAVAALTPLAVLGLGLIVARSTRRIEAIQYANQTVVGRRLEVFEQVAPKLNKLLCFFAFVGRWKEITPNEVLILKRDADEVMFTNRLLFSDALFGAYQAFTERFFAMFATVDGDALIRARIASSLGDRRRLPWWNPDMAAMFARQLTCEPADAQLAYDQLSAARSASRGDRLNLSTGVELTGSTRGGIPPVDRFLSRIAAVPPPPAAICSKTSKRGKHRLSRLDLGEQSLAVQDAGAFGCQRAGECEGPSRCPRARQLCHGRPRKGHA